MYRDDELREMKLDIPVQFNGKAEIVGFTQYVAGLVMEYFPNYMKVQVTIKSVERPEAIIIREAKQDEPLVKIFRLNMKAVPLNSFFLMQFCYNLQCCK